MPAVMADNLPALTDIPAPFYIYLHFRKRLL